IEVGYGLEGVLTDALSSVIIQQEILPAFRQGQFYGGIQAGVTAIQSAIKGEYQGERQPRDKPSGLKALLILIGMVVVTFL
ncbi:MAG TPA: methanol dehydrogenase, partial [Alcanivorax sp.]|nr:methanol dehydrogenase [Alcanivorax sp.]